MPNPLLTDTDLNIKNQEVTMRLSLEEMDMLSVQLEKAESRLHNHFAENPTYEQAGEWLEVISQLQRKLRDRELEKFTEKEEELLASILENEIEHIHGHGMGIYEAILNKIE
jgi:hypothetical protein